MRFFSLWALAVCLVAGCRQGEGDRCEIDGDCKSGLTCENPLGTGGQCTSRPGQIMMTPMDAAMDRTQPDGPADTAAQRDTGPDAIAQPQPDASRADAAPDRTADAASDASTD